MRLVPPRPTHALLKENRAYNHVDTPLYSIISTTLNSIRSDNFSFIVRAWTPLVRQAKNNTGARRKKGVNGGRRGGVLLPYRKSTYTNTR